MFVGSIIGDPRSNTPPSVNIPPGDPTSYRPGESGRVWEVKFLGYFVQSYYDAEHPMRQVQPGTFYAMTNLSEGYLVEHEWLKSFIKLSE